jgi:Zn-dependent protease/predicted transcriptional regulator
MFGRRITLFKLFGFAVRIDASWLIIAALVTWTLAVGFFPRLAPGLSTAEYWWMGLVGALALFGSIVVHELSHSLVARRHGLPMAGITLFVFGGVAEMTDEPPDAKTEFLMAIAGPAASVVIGGVFYLLYHATTRSWPVEVTAVLGYLAWINWALAAFNLIPAFPLDGGRVLRSILWWRWKSDLPRATRIAAAIGSGFGIVLMALGVLQLFNGNFVGAVWWFLIGMFLRGAAKQSYEQLLVRVTLQGQPVRRFMTPNPVTVEPGLSVQQLVEDYIYSHHYKMFPVVDQSHDLVGCVTTEGVKAVPRDEWSRHSVQEILQPCGPQNSIHADADALQALATMNKTGASRLLVVDGGHLAGVVTLRDLLAFLSLKLDLDGHRPGQLSGGGPLRP